MPAYFKHLLALPQEVFRQLWSSACIALDTNILLHLYRLDEKGREELFSVLEQDTILSRLFIPHQVALEFFTDRPYVIASQHSNIEKIKGEIQQAFSRMNSSFAGIHKYHPFISHNDWRERLYKSEAELISELVKTPTGYPKSAINDPFINRILLLVETRIGDSYSDDQLKAFRADAETRYRERIPPGYKDDSKDGVKAYGDYIIWRQLIDEAKRRRSPVIFITDDKKEDWWQEVSGNWLGARPELRKEFFEESQQDFLIASYEQFIRHASEASGVQLTDNSLQVLAERSEVLQMLMRDAQRLDEESSDWLSESSKENVEFNCRVCGNEIQAKLGMKPGSTAWAHCAKCGTRTPIHRQVGGGIRLGTELKQTNAECPVCSHTILVQIPEDHDVEFIRKCPKCESSFRIRGKYGQFHTENLSFNATYRCPHCSAEAKVFILPNANVAFVTACTNCHQQIQITGSLDHFDVALLA